MSVLLRDLLADLDAPNITISGLCEDSRAVQPGDAFVAVRGDIADGHDFVQQAHSRGAVAVLCEHTVVHNISSKTNVTIRRKTSS